MFRSPQTYDKVDSIPKPENLEECSIGSKLYMENCDSFVRISPDILIKWLSSPESSPYCLIIILDCRFKYEYFNGHIISAYNVLCDNDFQKIYNQYKDLDNVAIVFHCEFSKERGPHFMERFRDYDRQVNISEYPKVNFPNIFLLDGGYSKFYEKYHNSGMIKGGYIPMNDKKYVDNGEYSIANAFYQSQLRRPSSSLQKSVTPLHLQTLKKLSFTQSLHFPSSPQIFPPSSQ